MKNSIITIIKFIIFTAIFYLLLIFNVFHIGEKIVPVQKDYLQETTEKEDMDLENRYMETDSSIQKDTGHNAANNTDNLSSLCKQIEICDNINFQGTFSTAEKYSYTKIIGKIVTFIDENGSQDKDIKNVIKNVQINKGNGTRRGYATRNTIILNLGSIQSQKEFIELSTHEMGHITDLGYIQGSSTKKNKIYTEFGKVKFSIDDLSLTFYALSRNSETVRKSEAKKKDFCSGYGMSDPFEDFSECFNLYTNHNSLFRKIAKSNTTLKKKYNFIASIFDGEYINTNSNELNLVKNDINRRPWDTTKLSN